MVSAAKRLALMVVMAMSVSATLPAAAAPASNAISLSPFLQNITLTTADTTKSFDLELSNKSSSIQEIDLTSQDFGSLNDTGGVLLKGASDRYSQRYGLTSWLGLETDTVVLNPGESRKVLVSVNNRQDLQPGGHYGAVVASVKSLDDDSGNRVAIHQQLLSLVLVTKQGGEHYDLKLASIEQNGNWLHLPDTIKLHFSNPGNVHVTPRGQVLLKNPAGTIIAQGVINTESAYILPASFRDVYVNLTPSGRNLPLPGLYRVEVNYRYDGINVAATKRYAVRFINLKLYLALAVLIVGGIWLARRFKNGAKRPDTTE